MIAPKTVAEIRRLLDMKTYSHRKIGKLLGVSRNSVGTIAADKRRNGDVWPEPSDAADEEPVGPPARCPGCGGFVYMPCLLCNLRKEHPRTTSRPRPTVFVSAALNLRPEHRQRYEEVRARRRQSQSSRSA
jgi:hypothetical protein